jgi:hypothetical protein
MPKKVGRFGRLLKGPSVDAIEIIVAQIRSMNYGVKIFRINQTVEMHAVDLAGEHEPQIARCNDGDGPDEEYRCACLLAGAVGITVGGF